MKTLLFSFWLTAFWLLVLAGPTDGLTFEKPTIPEVGMCVVEFNAGFNSTNSVTWLDELSDCKGRRVDISVRPEMQKKHQIVVVPTIIVFNEGVEVKRFQANILMELEATKEDVQCAVNNALSKGY